MRCCNALRGGMKLSSQHYGHKGRDTAASSGNQHKCHSCAAMALVLGPWYCLCWYGALHAGVPLWQHDDWSSHPLRHVARALLPPCAGAGASALSDACTAIAVQAALAVALMLLAQSFRHLFSLTLFAEYVFYIAATASVFAAIVDGCRVQRRAFLPGRFCFLRLVRG